MARSIENISYTIESSPEKTFDAICAVESMTMAAINRVCFR